MINKLRDILLFCRENFKECLSAVFYGFMVDIIAIIPGVIVRLIFSAILGDNRI